MKYDNRRSGWAWAKLRAVFVSPILKSSLSRKAWIAWVTLLVGLLLTVFASLQVKQGIDQERARQFAFVCDQVTLKIQDRLEAYALILRGGVALFAASKAVEREEWQAFVGNLRAWQSVPGAQGIGFSQVIPADRLAAHIAQIRSEGFPDYTVRPLGKRALYTSIIYLEPFRDRNLRAFGYDMYTEPVRRAAMQQACDTGEVALSGKVKLVQETETEVQAGTPMYAPVYRNGATVDTVAQRRAALLGWVYNPYRMNDMMAGILGNWESREGKTVDLKIYDGREATPANLLFDSQPANLADVHSLLQEQRMVGFNGRQWLLAFDRTSKASAMDYASAGSAAAGGFALSGMLFWLMLSITNTRNFALRIADKLTEAGRRREEALQESEEKTRLLLDSTAEAIYGIDMNGDCTFCNNACLDILGYRNPDELLGKNMHWQIHGKHADGTFFPVEECRIFQAFHKSEPMHVDDEVLWRADGTCFPAEYWSYPQTRDGVGVGAVVSFLDITELRKAQQARLDDSENRYHAIFQGSPDGIIIANAENKMMLFANSAACQMFGYSEEQLITMTVANLHPEDTLQDALATFERQAHGEMPLAQNMQCVRQNGEYFYADISASQIIINGRKHITGFFRDMTERKQAEDKLHLIASVFTHTSEGIMITSADGTIIDVNDAFSRIAGYRRDEVRGQNPRILSSGRQGKEFYAAFWRSLIEEGQWCGENWNRHKNGEVYLVKQTISAVRDAQGKTQNYVALFSDTTALRRAVDDLARRESEMRATLYSIADAVISLDINGCVLLMNPVAEQLTGWSESEAHGKPIEEVFCIIDEETRAKIDSPAASILHNGDRRGMALHSLLIARDGTERSIGDSVAPIFDQNNTITGVVLVFRDLTKERESANIILQQLAIIETYVGLVALTDMDGKLIYINAGGAKMLGVNRADELKTNIITDFIAPINFGHTADKLIPDAVNDKEWNGESMLKRIDGTSIPVSHTIFPICDADGIPRHIGIIVMDISLQKKLQEKLLLSERLAVIGRLVADVSHELNNPLAIVIGRTELILSHIDEQSASFKAKLETILKSAQRCKTILSNLLTYSKTIGKTEGPLNLPDLIREAVEAVNYQYDMSAIEVVVNCSLPEDIGIIGNKDALLSVFINIIRNAARAMAKKGALTFFVAKGGEGHLSIEIHDTGIGISKEKLPQIFKPFSSGWDDGDGTGLGLATSLGIIETHGGIMWVESEGIGKGSTFTILLPYKKLSHEEVEKDQAINNMEAK